MFDRNGTGLSSCLGILRTRVLLDQPFIGFIIKGIGLYILVLWTLAFLFAISFSKIPGRDILRCPFDFILVLLGQKPPTSLFYFTGTVLAVGSVTCIILITNNKKTSGSQGTAEWATFFEVLRSFSLSSKPGIVFGRYHGKPLILSANTIANRNVMVFGPPEAGKSRAYVRPNLFQAVKSRWSVIVTDPKGELTRDYKTWFEGKGYATKILNLVDFNHSDRWNPLDEVMDEMDAQIFCDVVMEHRILI